jgi:hypothetical protein
VYRRPVAGPLVLVAVSPPYGGGPVADSGPPSSETAAETAAAWGVADAYRDGGGNRRRP